MDVVLRRAYGRVSLQPAGRSQHGVLNRGPRLDSAFGVERSLGCPVPTWVVRGELDLATVGCAEAVLDGELDSVVGDVVLDVSTLGFIGFAGLELLVRLVRRMATGDRRVVIAHPTWMLRRAAEIAGVELVSSVAGRSHGPSDRPSTCARGCGGQHPRALLVATD
jgi:anti-anti-sigma factor